LFRTTVRLDFAAMPWPTVVAFFVPVLAVLVSVYAWQRWRTPALAHGPGSDQEGPAAPASHRKGPAAPARYEEGPAAPAVRTIGATFGNSVQVGIPLAAALFGEAGLALHIALVSLHALVLLSVLTTLAELDLARAAGAAASQRPPLSRTLALTARNTLVHPVVLPVVAGMVWNAGGLKLHPVIDEALVVLGSAVVPVCLVLIGLTLAYQGLQGRVMAGLRLAALKLLVLPAAVLVVAHWGFGLAGLPLQVAVMMAALPAGSNALIFAQRYATLESEATANVVFSTLAFVVTASLWLAVLALVG